LESLANGRASDIAKTVPEVGESWRFSPKDPLLELYVKSIEAAKLITLRASFRWWEVKARRHALSSTARETELQRQQRAELVEQPKGT
jgi:hypothetical protein